MEIRPILSALAHHKTGTILAALQIAVSLAIIVNALFIVHARIEKINRPTGMDNHNLIAVQVRGFGDDYDPWANIQRDLDTLRKMPGVVDATITNHVPLSGSGSGTGIRTVDDRNVTPTASARFTVDEHGLDTLGANLVRGRNFYPEEIAIHLPGQPDMKTPPVVIITQALADKLFPNRDPLNKTVYWNGTDPSTIIGIVDHMQGSWVEWDSLDSNVFEPWISAYALSTYLVRTKPGQRDAMIPIIEKKLGDLNHHRVVRYVKSLDDIIKHSYELDRTMANILIVFIVLLVGLTALVIVGLASYFVGQRTRQIGTRRALGATQFDILRYFLVENWLITTAGATGGCVLTVAVSYWLETSFHLPHLDWRYLAGSVLVLWLIGQFAAYWPARRASTISPAIATRTV